MVRKKQAKRKAAKPVKPVVLANNVSPRNAKRRGPKKSKPRRSGVQPHHVSTVCSFTNPFCPAAKGSKWPDGTAGNTLTEQFRLVQVASVDSNGNACFVYAGAAPFSGIGSTVSGSTATFAATYNSLRANSLLATYGSDYRIVSFGAIVRCIASATTASGYVTLGTGQAPAPSSTNTMGSELYQEVAVKAIQPGMEMSWISTPVGTGAREFVPQSTTTTGQSSADWNALWIEIQGATASSTPLSIEIFMNVEFRPLVTARALTAIAKPNPPKSTVAESAVSNIHSSLGSILEGGVKVVEDTVAKHAKSALDSFLDDPLASIASLFL